MASGILLIIIGIWLLARTFRGNMPQWLAQKAQGAA